MKKYLHAQGMDLKLSDAALDRLAKKGYDPVYPGGGALPYHPTDPVDATAQP